MANPHGNFVWYELITAGIDRAQRFYSDVIGWTVTPGMPGIDYRTVAESDGDAVGGIMQPPPGHDGPTLWRGYIEVDDVDRASQAIVGAGGALHLPPMDVPDVGRLAMLADPQGATFYIIASTNAPSRAFQAGECAPGHAVWNEITAPDPDAAIAFYQGQFGWRQEGSMPMGPLGEYRFLQHGGVAIGAAMPVVLTARPGWQFYFQVAAIDTAVDRLSAAGGTVVQGPDQIPGGAFAVVAEDPEGARFGLVGPRATP